MKKLTFAINEKKYIRDTLSRTKKYSKSQIEDILDDYNGFTVFFTLSGENGICTSYEIRNEDNEPMFLNQFNDYQQEFFIECMERWHNPDYEPIGVVRICETQIL